jgi:hypothetical protein
MRPQALLEPEQLDLPPRYRTGPRPSSQDSHAAATHPGYHWQPWRARSRAASKFRYPGLAGNLAITLAIVTIAVASLIAAVFTCWHYWNEEHRATVSEIVRERHALDSFKQAAVTARSSRQQIRLLDEAIARLGAGASPDSKGLALVELAE